MQPPVEGARPAHAPPLLPTLLVRALSQSTLPPTSRMLALRNTTVKPAAAASSSRRTPAALKAVSRDKSSVATAVLTAAVVAGSLLPMPALAADLALGKSVFDGNCAACHAGGGNTVIVDHTLQKAAIEQYLTGGLTLEAITYQVENGKGAMPAWSGTLDDDEIQAVSAYVYDQAVNSKW